MEGIWLSESGLAKAFTTGLTLLIVCKTEGDLSPSLELGLCIPMAMCFTGIGIASASTLIFNGTDSLKDDDLPICNGNDSLKVDDLPICNGTDSLKDDDLPICNGTELDVGSAFSARIGGEDGLEAKIDLMGAWMSLLCCEIDLMGAWMSLLCCEIDLIGEWMSLFCCGQVDIGDIGDMLLLLGKLRSLGNMLAIGDLGGEVGEETDLTVFVSIGLRRGEAPL